MNCPKTTPSHFLKFSCLSLLIGLMFVIYPNSAQAGWKITVTTGDGNTTSTQTLWESNDSHNPPERTCHLESDRQTIVCSTNSESK